MRMNIHNDGQGLLERLWRYPLMEAILHRRSRRFGLGMKLEGGPLAYASRHEPQPLSLLEEAILAFAAAGLSGFCLGELPYAPGERPESGGGNIMVSLVGRTIASADAVHGTALLMLNDEGSYLIRGPQGLPESELSALNQLAQNRQIEALFQRMRVRLHDRRVEIPREVPNMPPFNKWSANVSGSTYFLPVSDLSALYINLLLACFSEEIGYFILDERNAWKPAGIGRFARSKGKHLHDDPDKGRVLTIQHLESLLIECLMAEQAFMAHNLSLLEQAMGLGGFTHFAGLDLSWFEALGFRMGEQTLAKMMGAGRLMTAVLNLLGKNKPVPVPLGLELAGEVLLKPYCPPYHASMEKAVLAFIDAKFSAQCGSLKASSSPNAWKESEAVKAGIPAYSEAAVAATIAYCEYVHARYGRFPAHFGPYRITLAHQAHHLDLEFYDRFFAPGAYTQTQEQHASVWHGSNENQA